MSGRLVGEVMDYAPVDLTVAERFVYVALAEAARDRDRIARYNCSNADLARRTGLNEGTVRNACTELAKRGLIKRLVDKPHKGAGGKHQEYELCKLDAHHRFTTVRDVPTRESS